MERSSQCPSAAHHVRSWCQGSVGWCQQTGRGENPQSSRGRQPCNQELAGKHADETEWRSQQRNGHPVLRNSQVCLSRGSLGRGAVRWQPALVEGTEFHPDGREFRLEATAQAKYRSLRKETLDRGEVSLYHRCCPHSVFLKNGIVKIYLVLIFGDRYPILKSQAPFSRMRTNVLRNK